MFLDEVLLPVGHAMATGCLYHSQMAAAPGQSSVSPDTATV